MKLEIKKILSIIGLGFISSLLVLLILEVVFAQVLVDFIISNVDNQLILSLIVLGLLLFTFIVSIVIGFLVSSEIKKIVIIKASIMAFIINFIIINIISYVSMWIFYPEVFSEVSGLEVFLIFPQVILYFSMYMLSHPFYLFILSSLIYFIVYVIFLEQYYEQKPLKKIHYKKNYRY